MKNSSTRVIKNSPFKFSSMALGLAMAGGLSTAAPVAYSQDVAGALEEVIVTARKVFESLQDVPVAVTAFSGETIDSYVMRDIREMEGFIPNVVIDSVSVSPAGASLYIRGVGTQEVERSFDPAVGVVIDGVPLSFVNGSMANTFDFASFEVLRGPQGTLFGRNTTGGVINVTRTKPTGELGFRYEATLGNDDRVDLKGVLNFPIVEGKLAGKLGFASQKDGGLRRNTLLGERVGDADNQQYNATFLWTPTEDFDALFTYVKYEDTNDGIPLQNITSVNANPALTEVPCILPAVVFGEVCGDAVTDIESLTQDYYNPVDFEWDSYTLNMNWDVGVGVVTTVLGYQETDEEVKTDFDGSSLNFFHANRLQVSDQTSAEIRFASSEELSDSWSFVAGVFWLEDEYELEQRTSLGAFGGADGPNTLFQNPMTEHSRDAWAVFGSFVFELTDQLNLTVGGRYTEEKKEFFGQQFFGGSTANGFPGFIPGTADDLFVFGQPIFVPMSSAGGEEDWDEFSPKIGLDYRINDDVLTYFSYSEGFRSGGFNGRNSDPSNIGPFDPEFVDNYELGMKGEFLDNRLRLNVAAFYTDYSDKQEEVIEPDGFGGSNTVVRNASTVEIVGLETELTFAITEHFLLNANFGYLDAQYDEYLADLSGDGIITDNSNLELRRVPEWTGGINGTYTMPLGSGDLIAFVGYRYTDEYFVEVANDPRGLLDERGVWDATLSYEFEISEGNSMKITAFGRDLTDEVDFNSAVVVPGVIAFGAVSGGREYGLQVSGSF